MMLIKQLDLVDFIKHYEGFLSRPKALFLEGDCKVHLRYIQALESILFTPPQEIKPLQPQLQLLKKFGYLKLDEIFEFIKIIRYFMYLKTLKCEGILKEWFDNIVIPESLLECVKTFESNGEIKQGVYLEFDGLCQRILELKREVSSQMHQILFQNKLIPYLVDKQIHLVENEECLLLKAGFHNVLKGQIIHRSNTGFFYVLPQSIISLKDRLNHLNNQKEEQLFNICKEMSSLFTKNLLFLQFINKEFDRFDSYQARLMFAKARGLEFLSPSSNARNIQICEFKHPALKEPKSISLDFKGNALILTGVNAGGKTMFLKSVLSVVFLAKYLLPMPINATKSNIDIFKFIHLILEDPQNSKNDISTFGGRMLEFSKILQQRGGIIGIDEIELGTDSDEAASLFKVLLEYLMDKDNKIIITTHHKRLASLMAGNPKVQLLAALFDEEKEMPTFSFLEGTIGKSYAFETALRYGIPKILINEAKKVYGEDKEKLNTLIEQSSLLEMKLQKQIEEMQQKQKDLDYKRLQLEEKEEEMQKIYKKKMNTLDMLYYEAINAAKKAAKLQNSQEIHRQMNNASRVFHQIKQHYQDKSLEKIKEFKIKDRVKYGRSKGVIISIQREMAMVQLDEGIKLKVPLNALNPSRVLLDSPQVKVNVKMPQNVNVSLDLHGMRMEEALEKLEEFISNSLIAGLDEVLIYHGIGTGKLSSVVRDFLKQHPKVVEFLDAPPKLGGFGAKIVKL